MEAIKTFMNDSSMFRRCFIYCSFFCFISFVQFFALACLVLLFVWGIYLLFYNEINRHVLSKTRFGFWLLAFLIVSSISPLIHFSDNITINVITQFYTAICFFVFYGLHTEKHLNFRREFFYITRFVIYATTVVGVLGLACLMADISFEVMSFKLIVYDNRFTGLYINPNPLGFMSVVGLFSVHLMTKSYFVEMSQQEPVSRIWLASAAAINSISLFLCDSNGAIVLLVAYVIFYVLYKMFGAEHEYTKKQIIVRLVACVFVGTFIVASAFFVRIFTQEGFTHMLETAEKASQKVNGQEVIVIDDETTFDHINTNLDSGRFKLWRQGASLFSDNPVFGISKGNIYDYGEVKFDNGIAFTNKFGDFIETLLLDFHNGYLMILVCTGVVGFLIFMIFGIRFAMRITKHLFKDKNLKDSILPCLYAFVCAYLVYAFFEESIMYAITFRVQYFWLILGYLACFLCKYEPENNKEISIAKFRIKKNML